VEPSVAVGRDTTLLREILDKTVERVGKELTNQPAVEAKLRHTIGNTYKELGQFDKAEAMLRESVRLRQSVSGETNLLATSLQKLAFVLMRREKLSEAESIARQSLSIRQKLFPAENLDVASSMGTLGFVLFHIEAKKDEAEGLLWNALSIQRKLLRTNDLRFPPSLISLALLLKDSGRLAEAEPLYREALAIYRVRFDNDHPATADVLHNLAKLLDARRQYPEAEKLLREGLALDKKLFGEGHLRVVRDLEMLAEVIQHQSRYDEAERFQREALLSRKKLTGEEDAGAASSLDLLGELLERQGKHAEAEAVYREAMAIRKKRNGSGVPDSILLVARVLWNQGKQAEAEALLQEVVPVGTEMMTNQISLLRRRGAFYARHSRWEEATDDLTKVIKLRPTEHAAYWALGAVLLETGDAESYRQFCAKVLIQFQATTSPSTAVSVAKECLLLPGGGTNLALVSQLVDFSMKNFNRNSTTRALMEYRKGNFQAAVDSSLRVLEATPIPGRAAEAHLFIAMAEACLGRAEAAWSAFDKARDMANTTLVPGKYGDLGPGYIDTLHARALLREAEATLKEKLGPRENTAK
jgi:tetratricopeptide (TPR) repeat protein